MSRIHSRLVSKDTILYVPVNSIKVPTSSQTATYIYTLLSKYYALCRCEVVEREVSLLTKERLPIPSQGIGPTVSIQGSTRRQRQVGPTGSPLWRAFLFKYKNSNIVPDCQN